MFEDSLVESSGRLAARHPWATAASFAAQSAVVGSLLLLSLVYTESLPTQRWINILQAPPPPAASATAQQHAVTSASQGNTVQNVLVVPREIPKGLSILHEDKFQADTPRGIAGDAPGGIPDGNPYGIASVLRSTMPSAPRLATSKVRMSSGVAQGLLVRQVNPQYPQLARQARIEGRVVLQATIGKDGSVQNLRLISGHPMLVQAAMEAVKQWLYQPYYLNGEAVEVDTSINVNFTLTP